MKLPRDVCTNAGRPFIDLVPETAASILRTIAAGWARASKWPEVNADAGEMVMTERLHDGMRAVLAAGGLPWGGTLIVLPGTESRSRPETSARTEAPPIDLHHGFCRPWGRSNCTGHGECRHQKIDATVFLFYTDGHDADLPRGAGHPFYERLGARMGRPSLAPGRSNGRTRSGRSCGGRPNPHSRKVEHTVDMETGSHGG